MDIGHVRARGHLWAAHSLNELGCVHHAISEAAEALRRDTGRLGTGRWWLGQILPDIPGVTPRLNNNVHFQCAVCKRSNEVAEVFQRHGIGVRVLGAAHGVSPDPLRIVAPRSDERERFTAAVADEVDVLVGV
jgi:histidinol-phosphate/aromatic aminotransferase/cobyric acid decarboxylase-like protein